MKKTLAVHTGGIGDFLLACPAIRHLSLEQAVSIAGIPERAMLAAGLVEQVVSIDAIGFESVFVQPSDRLREFVSAFDGAVVWMKDDDGSISRGLKAAGITEVGIYPGLPPADWCRHASEYYLECVGGEDISSYRITLEDTTPRDHVIIHPGSGGKSKNWPLDRFIEVASALERRSVLVQWIRGPAEEDFALPEGAALLAPMPLIELGKYLAGARGYVGNDSGVTHLAAACGCPTVAVFGPTNPAVWAPRGDHVTVVANENWPDIESVVMACETRFGL